MNITAEPDYHALPRRRLQQLCKKHGIPANKTNVFMADALSSLLKEKVEKQETYEIPTSATAPGLVDETVQQQPADTMHQGEGISDDRGKKDDGDESQESTFLGTVCTHLPEFLLQGGIFLGTQDCNNSLVTTEDADGWKERERKPSQPDTVMMDVPEYKEEVSKASEVDEERALRQKLNVAPNTQILNSQSQNCQMSEGFHLENSQAHSLSRMKLLPWELSPGEGSRDTNKCFESDIRLEVLFNQALSNSFLKNSGSDRFALHKDPTDPSAEDRPNIVKLEMLLPGEKLGCICVGNGGSICDWKRLVTTETGWPCLVKPFSLEDVLMGESRRNLGGFSRDPSKAAELTNSFGNRVMRRGKGIFSLLIPGLQVFGDSGRQWGSPSTCSFDRDKSYGRGCLLHHTQQSRKGMARISFETSVSPGRVTFGTLSISSASMSNAVVVQVSCSTFKQGDSIASFLGTSPYIPQRLLCSLNSTLAQDTQQTAVHLQHNRMKCLLAPLLSPLFLKSRASELERTSVPPSVCEEVRFFSCPSLQAPQPDVPQLLCPVNTWGDFADVEIHAIDGNQVPVFQLDIKAVTASSSKLLQGKRCIGSLPLALCHAQEESVGSDLITSEYGCCEKEVSGMMEKDTPCDENQIIPCDLTLGPLKSWLGQGVWGDKAKTCSVFCYINAPVSPKSSYPPGYGDSASIGHRHLFMPMDPSTGCGHEDLERGANEGLLMRLTALEQERVQKNKPMSSYRDQFKKSPFVRHERLSKDLAKAQSIGSMKRAEILTEKRATPGSRKSLSYTQAPPLTENNGRSSSGFMIASPQKMKRRASDSFIQRLTSADEEERVQRNKPFSSYKDQFKKSPFVRRSRVSKDLAKAQSLGAMKRAEILAEKRGTPVTRKSVSVNQSLAVTGNKRRSISRFLISPSPSSKIERL